MRNQKKTRMSDTFSKSTQYERETTRLEGKQIGNHDLYWKFSNPPKKALNEIDTGVSYVLLYLTMHCYVQIR